MAILQVSFGGGQKVVQSTGNPEEENPFHFRLKNRYVLFLANAPRQDVLPPVRVAAAPDVVDLTVRSFSLMSHLHSQSEFWLPILWLREASNLHLSASIEWYRSLHDVSHQLSK